MAKLTEYREKVQNLLTELANYGSSDHEVESQLIFDTERDHYQLAHVGWRNKRRIYGCVVHLDIKDDKIWVQHNGTEFDIAIRLAEMGIPKQDIVNGFHSSYMRQFTEFAVG
ncbi:XisI protein [Pseudanabaena sp. Chao 1811]|uniref:XisI protein n=1 Tax=Pseudanabaena sp. Chao 1811 TaxID=2963092 RepID=UPI0022F3EE87|nr:XisI protein [Pseudanabaena sp. Chao 1811]